MSLIEEALRRLQETVHQPADRRQPPQPRHHASQAQEGTSKTTWISPWAWTGLVWMGLSVLVVGVVSGALWSYRVAIVATRNAMAPSATQSDRLQPRDSNPSPSEASEAAGPSEDAVSVPAQILVSSRSTPELELNGVVEGVGEPFAIINGGIVRLGEVVEGATLLEVSKDTAKLRWNDQELVVRTSR